MENKTMKCIIAVHAGAGYHSERREADYKRTCTKACQAAMKVLKTGASAMEAVTMAIKSLEDASCTNAGSGSNLTLEGTVECDASIMDGKYLTFGAVGAISNVKNPICVAAKLVEEQRKGSLSLGRVPPCCMVGPGATSWAKDHGILTVSPEQMVSECSQKTYEDHKRRLQYAEDRREKKRRKYLSKDNIESAVDADKISDTVGAVCVDCHGNTAAGVSSGGVSLKQPGRIGPAACYGAGCWAVNSSEDGKPGVAIASSGTGEHLMKTLLARECADQLRETTDPMQAFQCVLRDKFIDSIYLHDVEEKFGGLLSLHLDETDSGGYLCELLWGHTTKSMCVGYMTKDSKPKTFISRMPENKQAGKTFVIEGHCSKL